MASIKYQTAMFPNKISEIPRYFYCDSRCTNKNVLESLGLHHLHHLLKYFDCITLCYCVNSHLPDADTFFLLVIFFFFHHVFHVMFLKEQFDIWRKKVIGLLAESQMRGLISLSYLYSKYKATTLLSINSVLL